MPHTATIEHLITRTLNVPPNFYSSLDSGSGDSSTAPADPFSSSKGDGDKPKIAARKPIKELLINNGVKFPEGTSATLNANGTLLVTNTPSNLDIVEQIVDAQKGHQPKQVKITTKFVEISQENTDELGFDWIVNPFGIGSAGTMFLGGGTQGNQKGRTGGDFVSPVNGVTLDGVPLNSALATQYGVSNGLRSGDSAISRNSIDAVLNNPNRTAQQTNVAPGVMSLTGLFSGGQVQMIMRGLAQKKGTESNWPEACLRWLRSHGLM